MMWLTGEVFGIFMRWAHIASAAALVGGLIFARLVAAPQLGENKEEQTEALDRLDVRFRPLVFAAIAGLVISGCYNYLWHTGHTPYYHAWFGLKVLLALHVFAATILAVRPAGPGAADVAKRLRRMSGAIISGLVVILIGAYLRLIY